MADVQRPPNHLVHATAIAAGGRGALIRGPSGSGKSDLALRCLALGPTPLTELATLISDDQVAFHALAGGGFKMSAPSTIFGKIEVRGVGIFEVAAAKGPVELVLVADIAPPDRPIERMPDTPETTLFGLRYPLIELHAFEPSAPLKLLIALAHARRFGSTQQLGPPGSVDET